MAGSSATTGFVILLVEDEPADVRLIEEAIESLRPSIRCVSATDGVETFDLLYGRGDYEETHPDLILLDLKLPDTTGQQLLTELKQHDEWKVIPVVVLSQIDDPKTIEECYRLGANAYIVKPGDFEGTRAALQDVVGFWIQTANTPTV